MDDLRLYSFLTPEDTVTDAFRFAPVLAYDNATVNLINLVQAVRFAKHVNTAIMVWVPSLTVPSVVTASIAQATNCTAGCDDANLRSSLLRLLLDNTSGTASLLQLFIPGAPVTLTRNMLLSHGIVNGASATLHSLVMRDEETTDQVRQDVLNAAPGAFVFLPQPPLAVCVQMSDPVTLGVDWSSITAVEGEHVVTLTVSDPNPVRLATTQVDRLAGVYRTALHSLPSDKRSVTSKRFPYELNFACTVHRGQGRTLRNYSVILESYAKKSTSRARGTRTGVPPQRTAADMAPRMNNQDFMALVVALSRGTSPDNVRILGLNVRTHDDLFSITRLVPSNQLVAFLNGYRDLSPDEAPVWQVWNAAAARAAYDRLEAVRPQQTRPAPATTRSSSTPARGGTRARGASRRTPVQPTSSTRRTASVDTAAPTRGRGRGRGTRTQTSNATHTGAHRPSNHALAARDHDARSSSHERDSGGSRLGTGDTSAASTSAASGQQPHNTDDQDSITDAVSNIMTTQAARIIMQAVNASAAEFRTWLTTHVAVLSQRGVLERIVHMLRAETYSWMYCTLLASALNAGQPWLAFADLVALKGGAHWTCIIKYVRDRLSALGLNARHVWTQAVSVTGSAAGERTVRAGIGTTAWTHASVTSYVGAHVQEALIPILEDPTTPHATAIERAAAEHLQLLSTGIRIRANQPLNDQTDSSATAQPMHESSSHASEDASGTLSRHVPSASATSTSSVTHAVRLSHAAQLIAHAFDVSHDDCSAWLARHPVLAHVRVQETIASSFARDDWLFHALIAQAVGAGQPWVALSDMVRTALQADSRRRGTAGTAAVSHADHWSSMVNNTVAVIRSVGIAAWHVWTHTLDVTPTGDGQYAIERKEFEHEERVHAWTERSVDTHTTRDIQNALLPALARLRPHRRLDAAETVTARSARHPAAEALYAMGKHVMQRAADFMPSGATNSTARVERRR